MILYDADAPSLWISAESGPLYERSNDLLCLGKSKLGRGPNRRRLKPPPMPHSKHIQRFGRNLLRGDNYGGRSSGNYDGR